MPTRIRRTLPWEQSTPTPHGGRANPNDSFYNSRQWRTISKAYLSAHPFCECPYCKKKQFPLPANVVDHKVRINDGGDPLSDSNFMAMNKNCHNKKSAFERHGKKL